MVFSGQQPSICGHLRTTRAFLIVQFAIFSVFLFKRNKVISPIQRSIHLAFSYWNENYFCESDKSRMKRGIRVILILMVTTSISKVNVLLRKFLQNLKVQILNCNLTEPHLYIALYICKKTFKIFFSYLPLLIFSFLCFNVISEIDLFLFLILVCQYQGSFCVIPSINKSLITVLNFSICLNHLIKFLYCSKINRAYLALF